MAASDAEHPADNTAAAENAVRDYLTFLHDPGLLVDQDRLREIEETVARATDPIERLLALSELERARTVDGDGLVAGFVRHAKQWALREGVSLNAFRRFGINENVLRAAGLSGRARPAGGSAGVAAAAAAVRAGNRQVVTAHEIEQVVRGWSGEFLVADIASKVGGSPMTIRKALDALIAAGAVRRIGPVVGHIGPGRAPLRYERISPAAGGAGERPGGGT